MDIGMPTLLETETLEECVGLCCELGLDFIELNMNFPQYQLHRLNADELLRIRERSGVYFTIHLPETLTVCDFNPAVTQAHVRTALAAVSLAKAIGAPVVNMHLDKGIYITLPDRKVFLFQQYRESYLSAIAAFRGLCAETAGDSGVKVCVENTDGFFPHEREAVELLLEESLFGLTLDIGHSHAAKDVDEAFFLERREKLAHMHVHDARGPANHLALGDGEIDLSARLALAEVCGCRLVLETKTVAALRSSVPYLRRLQGEG